MSRREKDNEIFESGMVLGFLLTAGIIVFISFFVFSGSELIDEDKLDALCKAASGDAGATYNYGGRADVDCVIPSVNNTFNINIQRGA